LENAFVHYVISWKGCANQQIQIWNDVFMPKQFSLPKISLILQKMRIGAKKFLIYKLQFPDFNISTGSDFNIEARAGGSLHSYFKGIGNWSV